MLLLYLLYLSRLRTSVLSSYVAKLQDEKLVMIIGETKFNIIKTQLYNEDVAGSLAYP
jgi:hypothetical protein